MKRVTKFPSVPVLVLSVLLVALSGLAGCGSKDTPVSAGEEAAKTLRVGVITVSDEPFDPALVNLDYVEQIQPLYDSLLNVDENGNYTPGLAEEWSLSEDRLTYTLKLREGVKFHDGSVLTSEDVKFTLEYYISDTSRQADAVLLKRFIASIDTPDAQTAVIHFTAPCTEFNYLLSEGSTGSGIIIPKAYFEKVGAEAFAQDPVGTGPFKLESFAAGDKIVYAANEDYWQGAPAYDKLILRQITDESTRIAELQAGNIDFAPIGAANASIFENSEDIVIETVDYSSSLAVFISGGYQDTGKATQNAGIRLALSAAIDRDALVDGIFEGQAKAAGAYGVFPFTPGYETERSVPAHDPEKAKALLAEANYPDAFEDPVVTLYDAPGRVYSTEVAQAIAGDWESVGIQVEIVSIDPITLGTEYTTNPANESFAGAAYLFDPPRKYSLHDAFGPFFPSNSYFGLIQGDDVLDKDVEALLSQNDAERATTVVEILDRIDASGVSIPLVYPSTNYAVSSKVKSWDSTVAAHYGNWFYHFELN
jgi:peptide/nickel transport system substrate-binding protein